MRSAVVHPSKQYKHYWQPPIIYPLTAGNPELALLSIKRIQLQIHGTGEGQRYPEKVMYLVTFLHWVSSLYVWYPSYHSSYSSCSVHYNKCSLSVLNIIPTNTSHKFEIVMENVTNVTIFVTGNFIQWYQGERLKLYHQSLSSSYFCS